MGEEVALCGFATVLFVGVFGLGAFQHRADRAWVAESRWNVLPQALFLPVCVLLAVRENHVVMWAPLMFMGSVTLVFGVLGRRPWWLQAPNWPLWRTDPSKSGIQRWRDRRQRL